MGQRVEWREDGHQLSDNTRLDILRFEVDDLNQVIKSCVGFADLYVALAEANSMPGQQVVPVSCFAVTESWPPAALAEGTRYGRYRMVEAATLLEAGFKIWPTSVFVDGEPDPRNEVHFDVIVAWGDLGLERFASLVKRERAEAREDLRGSFVKLLGLLGEPMTLEGEGA